MRKKGFTLLELLAVIVVLAIIALIVTPFVTNAIKEARIGAFKNSAYGIINAAELYYGEKLVHQDYSTTVIEIEKGSINPDTFKYKGGKIEKGYIEINELGKTKMYLWNNGYCALKTYNEAEIQITTTKKEECRFKTPRKLNLTSNVDGWTSLDITITMDTDEELVKYQYNISKDATSYDNTKWVDTTENKILINTENVKEDGEYYVYARGVNEDGEGEVNSIKVQIDRSPQELTIINSTGGTITKDKETYKIGEKVVLTATPIPATSTIKYRLKTLTYNDGENHDITNKKEFTMPKGPVTVSATWENAIYKDASKANIPELYDKLIPVKYNGTNWVYANTEEKWYDYNSKEWANAVVLNSGITKNVGDTINESDIALWYVWVPRYKYQLFNAANSSANPQQINIEFEEGTSTTGTVSCTTQTSGSGTSSETCTNATNGNWYTHPAFTFGTQQLKGLWVGKFEVSGSTSKITVKPNVLSLRNTTVSAFFNAIKKINTDYSLTNYDSHMMKNMEWGAVAYLSHSKYGIGEEVYINNSSGYYTGRSGGNVGGSTSTVATQYPSSGSSSSDKYYTYGYYTYDGKVVNYDGSIGDYATDRTLGTKASTTGNIYGIYDMSGGAWEYVMGNMVDSSNVFYSRTSGFTTTTTPDAKYYDAYTYNTSNATHARGKLGDATKETLKTFGNISGGWYSDSVNFPHSTYAWFRRGGNFDGDTRAGVFNFDRDNGDGLSYSARAVLVRN